MGILNDVYSDQSHREGAWPEFPMFAGFPLEIALTIWQCVLQRHRLISITITENDDDVLPHSTPPQPPYTVRNESGKLICGENYRLSVHTNHCLSPLLGVSRQSRQAALEFYRLHIPYNFQLYGKQLCLYLNPEFDFLHIKLMGRPEILVDFVHDAKAYDPLALGILKLGIGHGQPLKLELPMRTNCLEPPQKVDQIAYMADLQIPVV